MGVSGHASILTGKYLSEESDNNFLYVSAPALCGKTKLLKDIQLSAKCNGWQVAFVTLSELVECQVCSLDSFRNYISQQLNLTDYTALVDLILGDSDSGKMVKMLILIDDIDTSLLAMNNTLRHVFMKMLHSFHGDIVYRNDNVKHIFRVIIGGRYLDSQFAMVKIPLSFFKEIELYTFRKIDIQNTILDSTKSRGVSIPNKKTRDTWCQHIHSLSCEHPQAAITLINHLINKRTEGEYLHDDYIAVNKKQLFREYVSPFLDTMLEGLTVEEKTTLMVLSIFNAFDMSTLEYLNTHLKDNGIRQRISSENEDTGLTSHVLEKIYRKSKDGHGLCLDTILVKLLRKRLELDCERYYPEINSQYLHNIAVKYFNELFEKRHEHNSRRYYSLQSIYHSLQGETPLSCLIYYYHCYFIEQDPTRDIEDFKIFLLGDKDIQKLIKETNIQLDELLLQALNNDPPNR